MGRRLLPTVIALLVLAAPAHADQTCVAPPGTAAVEQYCEVVPAAGGSQDRHRRDPAPIPPSTAQRLSRSSAGQDLLRTLGHDPVTAKHAGAAKAHRRSSAATPGTAAAPRPPGDDPLGAVTSALSSGPKLGGPFVGVLLALTVLMLGWGWVAYRRRASD
jgi:hypothetical protein